MSADPVLAAIRLAAQLNARLWADPAGATPPPSAEVAARTVTADDAAHHVVDTGSVLGLDPLRASELAPGLDAAGLLETQGWVLVLPRPGHLGGLRGPAPTNTSALGAGAAVIGRSAGAAWIPEVVGSAIQWLIHPAAAPADGLGLAEAERQLSEGVLAATRQLAELDVAGGDRPDRFASVRLPAPYEPGRQRSLDRALGLRAVCLAALDDDGSALSSFEIERRRQAIGPLLGLADEVTVAAVSVPPRVSH